MEFSLRGVFYHKEDGAQRLSAVPVLYGGHLDTPCWQGLAITKTFCRAKILDLDSVVDFAGRGLEYAAALAAMPGLRSVRIIHVTQSLETLETDVCGPFRCRWFV